MDHGGYMRIMTVICSGVGARDTCVSKNSTLLWDPMVPKTNRNKKIATGVVADFSSLSFLRRGYLMSKCFGILASLTRSAISYIFMQFHENCVNFG